MKKTVKVVIEKEYEIELRPDILTQEFVNEFESYMWELEGETLDEKLNNLCAYVARQLAQYDLDFVEGVGSVASNFSVKLKEAAGQKIAVVYEEVYDDVETEVG
jgi:hypothetical protein